MTPAERKTLFARCERFLHGHGPAPARRALQAAADEAGEAELGDTYGAGDAIEAFEREIATLLGKPAAVFMPSGTMAQQIALRIWSDRRSCRTIAFHPTCHLEIHEQRGYAHVHGLHARLVGDRHRLMTRADLDAIAEPLGALLLELPQREIGGQLPTWAELESLVAWAKDRGVPLHLDGARLWEAQPYYGRPHAAIAAPFDTVYVSFYKILGGLAGAALAGPADVVAEARVWQRRLGGNLVTMHPFVLSARAGLRLRLPRIPAYVDRARSLARVLAALPGVRVVPAEPPTNMMHVHLPGDAERLLDASAAVARDERVALFSRVFPSDHAGVQVIELACGDGALAIGDDVVDALFRRVLG